MNIVIVPWNPNNPYQEQLARHLEEQGASVTLLSTEAFLNPATVSKLKPDVLHLHWLQPYTTGGNPFKSLLKLAIFMFHVYMLRARGVKIAWTVHDLSDYEKQNRRFDAMISKWTVRNAHAIIAHCNAAKETISEHFQLKNGNRAVVIPHGNFEVYPNEINRAEARRQLNLDEQSMVFLFFGAIKPYKQVPEMIDTFNNLRNRDARLIVAGRPSTREIDREVATKAKINPRIRYVPEFIPANELQVYLNACDVMVYTFRDIMTSGSVLLAMTFGRACIAPRMGCLPEVLDESMNFLYDASDEEGLFKAMQQAIDRRGELATMGALNQASATDASWDRIATRTLELFRSL